MVGDRPLSDGELMVEAISLARESASNGGGPFGAVIARKGIVIARGHNSAALQHDPTAHAEIVAIRNAGASLGRRQLQDCTAYCSCEPCPMCLSAFYWAGIEAIFYGGSSSDASRFGFKDAYIYAELRKDRERRAIRATPLLRTEAIEVFSEWRGFGDE